MPIKTLLFNTLTVAADYAFNTPPDNLTGYSKTAGSSALGIVALADPSTPTNFFAGPSSSSNSVWRDDTVLTGEVRKAFITTGLTNGNGVGPALLDASNNGYVALTSDGTGNTRLFNVVNSQIGTQIGSSITLTHANNQVRELRWQTGGIISMWNGSTQIGTNITNTTYTPIYAAALSRGGRIRSMASEYVAAHSVDQFNVNSDIQQGQLNTAYATTGFASITGISSDKPGLTVGGILDTLGDGYANISGFVEAGLYPILPTSVLFTFTDGSNNATITKNLTRKSIQSQVTFLNAIITDNTYFSYWLNQYGVSTSDGTLAYWDTLSGFSVNADGGITSDIARTVPIWVRDFIDGKMYEFNVTVNEYGEVVDVTRSIRRNIRKNIRRSLVKSLN